MVAFRLRKIRANGILAPRTRWHHAMQEAYIHALGLLHFGESIRSLFRATSYWPPAQLPSTWPHLLQSSSFFVTN